MDKNYLKQLQSIEFKLLLEFIRICQKYDLRYYVLGGTLLGAVRHNGFIPWDDDIDVGMPRKDYNKFLQIAQAELPSHLFLQNYKTEKDFTLNFTKIRNNNTTFVEYSYAHLDMNHGVYIDIFPLDGISGSRVAKKIDNRRINWLYLGICGHYLIDTKPIKLHNKIIRLILKTLYTPLKLHKMIDGIVERYDYDKCDLVSNHFGAWGKREIVPREYFGAGCELEFENVSVMAPYNYEKYLTNIYGDYMTPPPKEQQISHHETSLIDLSKSYKEYKHF